MAAEEARPLEPAPLDGLRIGIAQGLPLRMLDQAVTMRLFDALTEIGRAGVALSPELLPIFDDMARVNAKGSIVVAEAYAIHRDLVAAHGDEYDPFVRARVERGKDILAADYVTAMHERAGLVRRAWTTALPISMLWSCRRVRSSRRRLPNAPTPRTSFVSISWSCAMPRSSISSTCARSRCRCRAAMACRSA